jgi:hypothetical protein
MRRALGVALGLGWLAAAPAVAGAAVDTALPFISDDNRKALAEARAERLPLFIEAWAPW